MPNMPEHAVHHDIVGVESGNEVPLSEEGRLEAKRAYQRAYQKSEKFKIARRRYLDSETGREAVRRAQAKYRASPIGKEKARASRLRYLNSPKGRVTTGKAYARRWLYLMGVMDFGQMSLDRLDCWTQDPREMGQEFAVLPERGDSIPYDRIAAAVILQAWRDAHWTAGSCAFQARAWLMGEDQGGVTADACVDVLGIPTEALRLLIDLPPPKDRRRWLADLRASHADHLGDSTGLDESHGTV